jgi:hypothetical protein
MKKIVPNPDWPMDKIAASALFDVDFYLAKYPDVAIAGVDPFEHYSSYGWQEGRDPSELFNTKFYLQAYPDVAAEKVNPLNHYALNGAKEGRAALPPQRQIDSGKDIVLGARSARIRAAGWASVPDINSPLAREEIQRSFSAAFKTNLGSVVISISHDQYTKSVGGVQTAIAIEQNILSAAGWTYIHLSPASPLPFLADASAEDATFLVLTLGGIREGVVRLSDFLAVVSQISQDSFKSLNLVVHHLMGFSVETVAKIAGICKAATPMVWVHDFFSLCTNPFLLRNDVAFCNAPSINSSACLVCCEGVDRKSHIDAIRRFFDELQPIVIAPSKTALDFWKDKGGFSCSNAVVHPLAYVELGTSAAEIKKRPLRVAHLGAAASHKGWATFKKIVERHAEDERYKFFRLGFGATALKGLTEVLVEVGPGNVDAMIEAVSDCEIDVVINWSSCFETFSFITMEALAAGAFVVARRDAGNVWPAVVAVDSTRGMSVASEIELRALFMSGEIAVRATGPLTRGRLLRSRGTADLLLKEASFV